MLVCSLLSILLGCLVQGFDIALGCNAAITGFTASSVTPAGYALDETVAYILNRGGMTSMVSIILVCFCGFSMTTILTHGGFLEKAIEPLARNLNTRWKTMLTAEIATLVVLSMGGISYVSSVFVGEAWQKPFIQNGMGRPCLSRTLEDVGTCAAAVIPWCSSAMFYVEPWACPCGAAAALPRTRYCPSFAPSSPSCWPGRASASASSAGGNCRRAERNHRGGRGGLPRVTRKALPGGRAQASPWCPRGGVRHKGHDGGDQNHRSPEAFNRIAGAGQPLSQPSADSSPSQGSLMGIAGALRVECASGEDDAQQAAASLVDDPAQGGLELHPGLLGQSS